MVSDVIKNNKAYQYAINSLKNENVGVYVKKQCKEFLRCLDDESEYYIDEKELNALCGFLSLINIMPNKNANENLAGFQYFFIINALCVRRKSNKKRRYELSIMLIARKNGKTMLSSLIFLLLMLMANPRSEFYSVSADRDLAGQLYKEFVKILDNSPNVNKFFKVLRNEIRCTINNSVYKVLALSNNRLDGRLATAWLADEAGALPNSYPIESMQSSQTTLEEKFGIIISTAYPTLENPMIDNVDYAKKVLDGLIEDDTIFSLLFEPDKPSEWTKDIALYQSNPLSLEVEVVKDSIMKKRQKAMEMTSALTNFKTKHLNIWLDGDELEVYISLDDLRKCKIQNGSYNWKDKEVYIGVDLALSTDNCGISMMTYDTSLQKYICKTWAFYPTDREDEKTKLEKVPYDRFSRQGYCFPCGNRIVDYGFIEDFVVNLEKECGVKIKCITYDKYNCMSSVSKWETALPYAEMREQVQYSKHLHIGTKRLREVVLEEKFLYEENQLLEINFQNAKLDTDTALNQYVNKKKSTGRIDMLDAIINNMCSMVVDEIEGESVYESREEGFIFF